jgi:hypothetical protein
MNMDWSLCEALATTNMGLIRLLLHIYDINCQYCKHLLERIQRNDMLSIPKDLTVFHAIGQFHIHGHKDDCLYRWATTYVPGAGVIDGEVLETLWAVLNTVSAATRTASLAHRTEILDDHMNDSNLKKMLHIGETFTNHHFQLLIIAEVTAVIGRYTRAVESLAEARAAYEGLNATAPDGYLDIWEASVQEAELQRSVDPTAMDIMQSRIKTGQSLKDITADLLKEEADTQRVAKDGGSTTDWLLEGLKIEDDQYENC